jgi:hypothetical protein
MTNAIFNVSHYNTVLSIKNSDAFLASFVSGSSRLYVRRTSLLASSPTPEFTTASPSCVSQTSLLLSCRNDIAAFVISQR